MIRQKTRPFIPWIGSKEKLIPYIWQVFPSNPKLYLEPFGGGGALLLGIQPKISRMDIYNDFNCDLVNLFLCARECTIQLVQELKFLPLHSRAEFDLLKEFMKHKELLQQRIADERNAVMECFSGEERKNSCKSCGGEAACSMSSGRPRITRSVAAVSAARPARLESGRTT